MRVRVLVGCLLVGFGVAPLSVALAAPPAAAADQVQPLLIGARPAALTLSRADGSPFDLAAAIASQPTIVIFYRGGW